MRVCTFFSDIFLSPRSTNPPLSRDYPYQMIPVGCPAWLFRQGMFCLEAV